MAVYLDDQVVDCEGETLGELLVAAARNLESGVARRIIVEVKIGDETVPGDDLDQRSGDRVGETDVRLYSALPQQLAIDALEGALAVITEADQLQRDAGELLQQDQSAEAMKKLAPALMVWQQVQQVVQQSTRLAGLDLNDVEVNGEPAFGLISAFRDQLTGFMEAHEAADTVALADALAYEWPENSERWQSLITTLIKLMEPE